MKTRLNSLRSTSRVKTETEEGLPLEDVASEGLGRRTKLPTSALGLMLILIGVLGAVLTTRAVTRSVPVLASNRDLAAGHVLSIDDLQAIDVPQSSAKFFIGRNEATNLVGSSLVSSVESGIPITPQLLTQRPTLDPSTVLVSVAVEQGNYPPMLEAGDDVSIVVSPDVTIVDAAPPRIVADRLRVWDVSATDEGVTVVTLIGNADVAIAVAGAGSVHLGLVPSAEVD